MKVGEILTTPVVTVSPTTPIATAAKILADQGFAGVPVLDQDYRLIGIVTEADLIRDRIRPDPRIHRHQAPKSDQPETVSDVMTTDVESVTPGADVHELAQLMLSQNFRCVPVVDGRRLVGVVTRRDVLAAGIVRSDADLERKSKIGWKPLRIGIDGR